MMLSVLLAPVTFPNTFMLGWASQVESVTPVTAAVPAAVNNFSSSPLLPEYVRPLKMGWLLSVMVALSCVVFTAELELIQAQIVLFSVKGFSSSLGLFKFSNAV